MDGHKIYKYMEEFHFIINKHDPFDIYVTFHLTFEYTYFISVHETLLRPYSGP